MPGNHYFWHLHSDVGSGRTSFIMPIVEIVQSLGDPAAEADDVLLAFVRAYEVLDVPFSLRMVILDVSLILTVH